MPGPGSAFPTAVETIRRRLAHRSRNQLRPSIDLVLHEDRRRLRPVPRAVASPCVQTKPHRDTSNFIKMLAQISLPFSDAKRAIRRIKSGSRPLLWTGASLWVQNQRQSVMPDSAVLRHSVGRPLRHTAPNQPFGAVRCRGLLRGGQASQVAVISDGETRIGNVKVKRDLGTEVDVDSTPWQ
jgi:hypothetical protein